MTRKRSRSRQGTFAPAVVMVAAVAVFSAMVPSACGFSITSPLQFHQQQQQHSSRQVLLLQASATEEVTRPRVNVAVRVKPKKRISKEKRQQALQAMNGGANGNNHHLKVDSALQGVDAQVLELLSEHFLYPESSVSAASASVEAAKDRPKGRPEFVPGAMNYETMLRFREKQEVMKMVGNNNRGHHMVSDTTIAPYSTREIEEDPVELGDGDISSSATVARGKKTKGVKGVSATSSSSTSGIAEVRNNSISAPKRRKRVVKSLPQPRSVADKKRGPRINGKKVQRKRTKGSNLELHKYYRTELLGPDEEYSLGMKVLFMVKCESVHEGLSTSLMRLPTIPEWAEACGFTDEDKTYVPMEGDNQIRPAGSEAMFVETDPNMFVGNGLAHTAGPGRGRGRAKKPPPTALKDFYDDSELKAFNKKARDANEKRMKKKDLKPINRGTVTDFIDMMLTSREAKQRMVQCNMRLVVSIARKYSNVGVNLQDLVQEGSLGLSRAAEKFEPSKGFKFSTYASW